jgi:hypothetical protein
MSISKKERKKEKMMSFEYGQNVVVERKGKVMFGQVANVRQFFTNSLITVKYTDGQDTWFRSYYDDDKNTKIEHDEIFA